MSTVLLAGATGVIGRHVAHQLAARGYTVRRLVRGESTGTDYVADLRWAAGLHGACKGVEAVISCAGASMRLGNWKDRAGFLEIDWEGNRNLIDAAAKAGVGKFVYVSLANGPALVRTEYALAHEKTVDALSRSGLAYAVVRPTGIYGFFLEILRMASKNRGIVIGKGSARTNPIHEADAARACVESLQPDAPVEMAAGGPVVYTRREIIELAFECLGKQPAVRRIPAWAFAPVPPLVRLVNRRMAGLAEFGTAVTQSDCVAPPYGLERLDEYFRKAAASNFACPSPVPPSGFSATSR
jgi:uncharacterized protein YbjT (DUF2867 family)